jgi:putative restriction endonuclease
LHFFVGITDRDWFDHLSRIDGLDEVNFWQPSGNVQFRALHLGVAAVLQSDRLDSSV